MRQWLPIALLLVAGSLLLWQCTGPAVTDDSGGSEITNGKVLALDGTPAQGITVTGYPEYYIKGNSSLSGIISTVTDERGKFELEIDSGHFYNVFIIDSLSRSGYSAGHVGEKTDLGTVQLDTLSYITGTIQTADTPMAEPYLIVYCLGTPYRTDLYSNETTFRFDDVPPGSYVFSVALPPKAGCGPDGCDTTIGGSEGIGVTVGSGIPAVIDTVVNTDSLGVLP